ncbi:hypothetical protein AB835_04700 [Candidatus Endobugula sertula]|uniref:Terminase large subunit gp17-like C-terminal domain-containing protein n=1 Tax=Candidatus Endobugula sertula TaxID=62101 RepID=A0A1D2QRI2_9GAMM|nr:hypothetical protein AB835_04700 [Candidatus Endobugula sertula]
MNKQEREALSSYLKSLPRLADKNRDERVQKALSDDGFWYFIQTYFPHHIDKAEVETSAFRRFIHDNLYKLTKKHKKLSFTAYRGGAKTTTISQLFTFWELVRKHIRYGVIVTATYDLAEDIFFLFKTEFEDNENLIADFKIERPGIWRNDELQLRIDGHDCKITGFGAGGKIRGTKFLSWRPDYLIIDDLEDDEGVESKHQRNKLYRWFNRSIMKLPARKKPYTLIAVGTVLHNDGFMKRLEERRDFESRNFPLVLQFPDDPDDPDSIEGLVLDDPEIDGVEIMEEYRDDKDSFMSEYQGVAIAKEGLTFEDYVLVDRLPKCEIYSIGLDPSMGKKKGDYFGIATLGKKGDKFYASVKGYRLSPTKLIPRIIAQYKRYDKMANATLAVETVAFQEFFKDVLKRDAKKEGVNIAVKELRNTAPKDLRIESIAPLVNDGTIQIDSTNHLLIEELDSHPNAAHDDLLDALEMAYRIFRRGNKVDHKKAAKKVKKRGFEKFKKKYT